MGLRAPGFWGRPAGLRAHALSPFAMIYGAVAAARQGKRAPRAALPTIAIGGLTLGGDGKTPTALALGRLLLRMGERPAFLTRGYGRVPPHSAAVEADLSRHGIADVGDEALILAATAPTIVGVDRQVAAGLAVTLGATALILDDGFHSRRLEPDLAILVVDESYGAGSGYCPPAGPLRAPLRAQFARADVTLFIDAPGSTAPSLEIPVSLAERWRARLVPDPDAAAHFRGARVLAFAGVGRPEKFELSLQEIGALVVACRWFPDHHLYRPGELKFLALQAKRLDARLVTTEKDAVRLGPGHAMETLPVSLNFNDEEQVAGRLSAALSEARKKRRG